MQFQDFAHDLAQWGMTHHGCSTLETAIEKAFDQAEKGDVILLSPACASFDQFTSFEHRGNHFKALVDQLKAKEAHHGP